MPETPKKQTITPIQSDLISASIKSLIRKDAMLFDLLQYRPCYRSGTSGQEAGIGGCLKADRFLVPVHRSDLTRIRQRSQHKPYLKRMPQ